jgi:hypothetical protein
MWLYLHRLVFLLCFRFRNTDSEGQSLVYSDVVLIELEEMFIEFDL